MQLKLKSLHLTDFKGVKDKTYEINETVTNILGCNGSGKTTIATAWYWLTADKDYGLKSNPNIIPQGAEECLPRVEAVIDINGKEIEIVKQQKITKSKPDAKGISKVTLSNTYEINHVPKTERDFREYLQTEGIDWNTFLALSHPNVFTSEKASDMRKVLFQMASEKSDFDIANMDTDTKDIAVLLQQYKLEEIEAMHKASKKKAEQQVKSIPDQIIGMEKSKADIDVAELELGKSGLNKQISEKVKLLEDNEGILKEYQESADRIMDLKFEMNAIVQKATDELIRQKRVIKAKIDEAENGFNEAVRKHGLLQSDIQKAEENIKRYDAERKELGEQYKTEFAKSFDESAWRFNESSTVCPVCGRAYELEKIEEIKAEFATKKQAAKDAFKRDSAEKMDSLIARGNELKQKGSEESERLDSLRSMLERIKSDKIRFNKEQTEATGELQKLPEKPDLSDSQIYEEMQLRLSNMEKAMETMNSGATYRSSLKAELDALQGQLTDIEKQIAVAGRNVEIDEQISEMQKKQREYEQAKADSEKILYQLDLLSKRKNELLVEEINQHFGIVRWILFDYQKNGGYKEVCIPTVDGKRFGESTNTGREIIAKLDICNSLQKFFETGYPVFLDGAESINNENVPKMDNQLILLKVTEDPELRAEGV